ncbi:hypothetical protein HDU96_008870 [Phlyctochytrium bullatum]|nr:hypothetical protein HDU96_008870 [Phlyctochytrium bullatum]
MDAAAAAAAVAVLDEVGAVESSNSATVKLNRTRAAAPTGRVRKIEKLQRSKAARLRLAAHDAERPRKKEAMASEDEGPKMADSGVAVDLADGSVEEGPHNFSVGFVQSSASRAAQVAMALATIGKGRLPCLPPDPIASFSYAFGADQRRESVVPDTETDADAALPGSAGFVRATLDPVVYFLEDIRRPFDQITASRTGSPCSDIERLEVGSAFIELENMVTCLYASSNAEYPFDLSGTEEEEAKRCGYPHDTACGSQDMINRFASIAFRGLLCKPRLPDPLLRSVFVKARELVQTCVDNPSLQTIQTLYMLHAVAVVQAIGVGTQSFFQTRLRVSMEDTETILTHFTESRPPLVFLLNPAIDILQSLHTTITAHGVPSTPEALHALQTDITIHQARLARWHASLPATHAFDLDGAWKHAAIASGPPYDWSRCALFLTYHLGTMMLQRPLLSHASHHGVGGTGVLQKFCKALNVVEHACFEIAQVAELVVSVDKKHLVKYPLYIVCFHLTGKTLLELVALSMDPPTKSLYVKKERTCVEALRKIGGMWPIAYQWAEEIENTETLIVTNELEPGSQPLS